MDRPPRDSSEGVLTVPMLIRFAVVSLVLGVSTLALFQWSLGRGDSLEYARTLVVTTLVVAQVIYLFNARFLRQSALQPSKLFTNRAVWVTAGIAVVLQLVFVYVPFMQSVFESRPLAATDWLWPIAIGALVFVVVEVEKFIVTKARERRAN